MQPQPSFRWTTLLGGMALLVFSHSMLATAQGGHSTGVAKADEQVVPAQAWGSRALTTESEYLHTVHLRVDGNVSGRVRSFEASGTLQPARARVYFVRNRTIVTSARSDEWGRFQVIGLQPGVYSVIAVGQEGFGVLSVAIRPFEEAPAEGVSTASQVALTHGIPPSLDMTLVPAAEFSLVAGMLDEELADVTVAESPPPITGTGGGGGGGGGGGLGGLLGVAGLAAGVTALATQDNADASPSSP